MFNWRSLWPRAEVRNLREANRQLVEANRQLSSALSNTTQTANDNLTRLEELRNQKCPSCELLKQTVNFHVYAAGSRLPMFDGVGPSMPKPAEHKSDPNLEQLGPVRASRMARRGRRDFIDQFLKSEMNIDPNIDPNVPEDSVAAES